MSQYVIISEELVRGDGPAWGCLSEFEQVLVEVLGGQRMRAINRPRRNLRGRMKACFSMEGEPELTGRSGPRVAIAVGFTDSVLLTADSLKPWRKSFDLFVAYVFDGFQPKMPPELARSFDAIFVSTSSVAERFQQRFACPIHVVPLGVDAVTYGNVQSHRPITLAAYGHQPLSLIDHIESVMNAPDSTQMLYHTRFARMTVCNSTEQRRMFWKMLHHSLFSLCLDPSITRREMCDHPYVSQRFFESLAAGTVVVGQMPDSDESRDLLDWPDAVVDVSLDPADWPALLDELASDPERLAEIRERNRREVLARHDWRHRVAAMLQCLDLPVPETLTQVTARLKEQR